MTATEMTCNVCGANELGPSPRQPEASPGRGGKLRVDLLKLGQMTKVGFDTSSLNRIGRAHDLREMCGHMAPSRWAPLLSALSVIEVLKWGDAEARDRLLDCVASTRTVADYRLLPLPHEIIQAEFSAWLKNEPAMSLGGEESAIGCQSLLDFTDSRDSNWSEAAHGYADAEETSHRQRVKALRSRSQLFDVERLPDSVDGFFTGLLGASESLAAVLNAWFAPALQGHTPVSASEARRAIEHLPTLRSYFVTIAVAAYRYGVQGASMRKGAPGALDIAQASYLPLTDIFVVDDVGMFDHMNEVVCLARLATTVVDYNGMRRRLSESFQK